MFNLPPSEIVCLFPPVDDALQVLQIHKEHLNGTHSMSINDALGDIYFLSEMGCPCHSDRYTKDLPSFGITGGETEREASEGILIQQGLEIDDPTEREHSGMSVDDLSNTFAANFGISSISDAEAFSGLPILPGGCSDPSDHILSSQGSLGPPNTYATHLDDILIGA